MSSIKKSAQYPDTPLIHAIWARAAFYGIHTVTELAAAVGIAYHTLIDRMHHPEKFTLRELLLLCKVLKFEPAVIAAEIEKGIKK